MEAPGVSKNFYFNLVDWGVNNIVAVGLKEHLYYWDATYCEFEKDLDNLLKNFP